MLPYVEQRALLALTQTPPRSVPRQNNVPSVLQGGNGTLALLPSGGDMFMDMGLSVGYSMQVPAERASRLGAPQFKFRVAQDPPPHRPGEGDQRRRGPGGCASQFKVLSVAAVRIGSLGIQRRLQPCVLAPWECHNWGKGVPPLAGPSQSSH
jgi:hypothetical protein